MVVAMASAVISSCSQGGTVNPAIPSDPEVEAKVESVLKKMSLKEKAGQMVQLSIDTITNDTIPAIDPAKLEKIIGEYKVGSILNLLKDVSLSREGTAAFVKQIQDYELLKAMEPFRSYDSVQFNTQQEEIQDILYK